MLSIGKQLTAEQRLHKAMTDLMGTDEFLPLAGILVIGTREIKDNVPTACTNGKNEYYGRAFVESLNDAEFRFLILHENYHKLYRHLTTWRHLYKEDPRRANKACDYVINLKLTETDAFKRGWITMPKHGLLDPQYHNMDAQQVYKMLERDGSDEKTGGAGNSEGFDEHDWEGAQEMTAEEQDQLAREIDEAIRQGATLASKVGSGGSRAFEDVLATQRDWRELLREFVSTTCAGHDYSTWRKPNRRYIGYDMLMPSAISETLGEIVIANDMSGSIDDEFLKSFVSEFIGICEQLKPSKVRILYWDTEVCREEVYLQDELANIAKSTKPMGGGGTMVECVPQYMNEHDIKPECVVVLTDGYLGGSWGQWSVPVLWCIKDNKSAHPSNGVCIHIN